MKKIGIGIIFLLSTCAFANDSGMPYIEVQDLTIRNADVGSKIEFHGPEAMSLFNALPSQDVTGYNRGFTATGKKKSIVIECKPLPKTSF